MEDLASLELADALSAEVAGASMIDETIQGRWNQVSLSDQAPMRPRLSDEEKRAKKRQNDVNYRRNKNAKLQRLVEDNKQLQDLKDEAEKLRTEKDYISHQFQNVVKKLREENEELTKGIRLFQSEDKFPLRYLQGQELNFQFGCHHIVEAFRGFEVSCVPWIAHDECYSDTLVAQFVAKFDEDVKSNVDTSDFSGLDGERKTVGVYSFPLSLVHTVEVITGHYGDITAKCLLSRSLVENAYILFCASIKEMNELPLEQVTEERMLKWKDAIRDAMRIDCDVDFAMEHLKKIARAYFGVKAFQELQNIEKQIKKLEKELCVLLQEKEKKQQELNALKEEKAKKGALKSEQLEACIAAAEDFRGKTVSSGLLGF